MLSCTRLSEPMCITLGCMRLSEPVYIRFRWMTLSEPTYIIFWYMKHLRPMSLHLRDILGRLNVTYPTASHYIHYSSVNIHIRTRNTELSIQKRWTAWHARPQHVEWQHMLWGSKCRHADRYMKIDESEMSSYTSVSSELCFTGKRVNY